MQKLESSKAVEYVSQIFIFHQIIAFNVYCKLIELQSSLFENMADTEKKVDEVEDDNISEMEDELPVCCFAFDLICCPQRYWSISKRPGEEEEEVAEEEGKEGEEKKEGEDQKQELRNLDRWLMGHRML